MKKGMVGMFGSLLMIVWMSGCDMVDDNAPTSPGITMEDLRPDTQKLAPAPASLFEAFTDSSKHVIAAGDTTGGDG